ncbi:hypothetical protein NP233_g5800 [Leucocoprinus birnbaumii]|uniref:N-acetyltransferase domain-containing protein n=1 Tax=Leucocoprinus birnbaumii TaxID=56174 RepID=A0AAD5VS66_9AGAR|nr:hypothetical protein NP233_g5800 [Leucocoprinus birnbaumii]
MSPRQYSNSEMSEFDYHLRLYHNTDNSAVQDLYLNAMMWHPQAPLRPFLKLVATTTTAKVLYAISALGLAMWTCYYPVLGRVISLTGCAAVLLQLGLAFRMISSVVKQNLNDDLLDVSRHYRLVSASGDEANAQQEGRLETSGPRAFWVVEATHKVTGRKELAGCAGLDFIEKYGKPEGELRRMVVSGHHTRRGVAAMVIKAAIVHAKAHNLPSIYLSTSSLQGPAIKLYEKHGWVVEERREMPAFETRACIVSLLFSD